MTKDMGHMTHEISREVMAMMEEISSESGALDPEREFTIEMYRKVLEEKGVFLCERAVRGQLTELVRKGVLKSCLIHHDGRKRLAFSKL